ncbi:MAG TPA: hypothetical protein VGQ57_10200 [Polyangiaceae bacterium]|jgi:hypothetical protein|nr:hypothetical protein [Polyangiaceae bacterium]
MASKADAVRQAVRDALASWYGPPPSAPPAGRRAARAWAQTGVRTELSTTVFSAEPEEWVRYLTLAAHERFVPEIRVLVHRHRALKLVAFEAEHEGSEWLATLLDEGLRAVRQRLSSKPHVLAELENLLFGALAGPTQTVSVLLSAVLPTAATRESAHEWGTQVRAARVVLNARLAHLVDDALRAEHPSTERRLGHFWPLVSHLVAELAYPGAPLDRFLAKVDIFARMTYVALGVLYDGRRAGVLQASPALEVYARLASEHSHIPVQRLEEEHSYFRLLGALGFMARGEPYASYATEAKVAVREYLDELYLRLSLSGAMPEVPEGMQPMTFELSGRDVRTPKPRIGEYGIQGDDDLDAWKAVDKPFRDLGFTLLRQLGMGEFGRVYEVLNQNNPRYPAHLALKVDRIKGKKKEAILEAEQAMVVGRDLAPAVHLIRLYDSGKLRGERYTYHVLQLVDGDTLDNLIGVTGTEHASVTRPPRARHSAAEAEREYQVAVSQTSSQLWRRERLSLPFRHPLSPAMILDLMSSILLWLMEVHSLNYAINDLKNGNLMMSRRGQLKGIDLDSYAPVHTHRDKVTDFMFLAVSLVLLLLSARGRAPSVRTPWEELIKDEARLRRGLVEAWPFGDTEALSGGRVTDGELLSAVSDLVLRSRHLTYAKDPELFAADVTRLINIKRRLLPEEFVID